MIGDTLANQAQAGSQAMFSPATTTPAPTAETFLNEKNYGEDLFKRNAIAKVTTDDIDQSLVDLVNKKSDAYADIMKYYRANGDPISPAVANQGVASLHKNIDTQISALQTEKAKRMQDAEANASTEYTNLASTFTYERQKLMGLEKSIMDEGAQPQSDATKMADLQAQKEQTMAKVDKLKKQFKANGIEQPEAILSQPTFAKPEAEQDNPAINQVLYDVGLGKYDDANGQVNAQALIDQTQKIPGLQGLHKEQIAEKLLNVDADIPTMKEIFYVSNHLQDNADAMVPVLKKKGLSDEEIANVVLGGFGENTDFSLDQNGDPKHPENIKRFNDLKTSLKKYGIGEDIIDTALENLGAEAKPQSSGWW